MDPDSSAHAGFNLNYMSTVQIIDKSEAISSNTLQPLGLRDTNCTEHTSKITLFFSIDFKLQLLVPALSGASTFKMRQMRFITDNAGDEKR